MSLQSLTAESNERHWKINDITDELKTIQYDFVSLNQRLALVEASNTEIENSRKECNKVAAETEGELGEIESCVKEASATLGRVEGFLHPCCGSGWRRVVNFDMTDSNTNCPSPWVLNTSPDGIRTCGRANAAAGQCDPVTFSDIGEPYSEVCGRARGYQRGSPQAFRAHIATLSTGPGDELTLMDAFVDGLVLVRDDPGDPKHIWTFAAGARQEVNVPIAASHCPCREGEVDYEANTGALPDFITGHFFCESALDDTNGGSPGLSPVDDIEVDDPLWDGLGCDADSDCCNFGAPPHFTRVLDSAEDSDIEARLCFGVDNTVADIGIEQIEIYVR